MRMAELIKTVDLAYKDGYVQCACGWRKDLGDGFNGYHIAQCPTCDPTLHTWIQRVVIYWDKDRRTSRADIGDNRYFTIKGSITVQFSANNITTHWGDHHTLEQEWRFQR